jgi:hypothetical protein
VGATIRTFDIVAFGVRRDGEDAGGIAEINISRVIDGAAQQKDGSKAGKT